MPHPEDPVVGDPPDGCGVELPPGAHRLDLGHPRGLRHHQHPFLALAQQDLVRGHTRLAGGHQAGIDLDADAAACRHLRARAGEPRGPHVLNRHDEIRGDELETRLEEQLLGEGIAHLHLRAPRLAPLRQLLGREAGAVDPVAPGPRADAEQDVPHTVGGGPDQVRLPQQADAHGVHQRVSGVPRGEADLTAERRHPDAVAVVAHAAHDPGEEIPVPGKVERAEAQAVEDRDGASAHGEDVAQNAADSGRGALVWLDRRGMIVRLDLEGHRPAVRQAQDAGVLAGPLDHVRPGGGEGPEDGLRVLVAAVLRPERREHAQLGERRRTAEQLQNALVLHLVQVVLAHHLGGDRTLAREGRRLGCAGHRGAAHVPVLRFPAARSDWKASESTRVSSAGGSSWTTWASSPASSQTPPQWGQVSI
jgi:hypothetical protein